MSAYRTGTPQEDAPPPPRWSRALAAMGIFFLGTRVPAPLPGVDAEAARAFLDETSGARHGLTAEPLVPLLGSCVGTLVLARVILAMAMESSDAERRRRWRRNGLLLFLAAAAAQGLSLALYLEARRTAEGIPLVPDPGWGLRLATVAIATAAAGVTWRLASEITRARVAHGPLALLLVASVVPSFERWYGLGVEVANDTTAPLGALMSVTSELLPTGALLLALACWWPATWGRAPLVRIAPLSALDLVVLPLLAGAQAVSVLELVRQGFNASSTTSALQAQRAHPVVAFVAAMACTAWLARWLRAQPGAPRPRWVLAPVVLLLVGVLVATTGMVVTAKGVPRHVVAELSPARNWTEVSLRGDAPHAADDAPRLVARLRALHHRAEVITATGDHIRLRVHTMDGDAHAAVASVLAPGRLEFRCALEDQTAVSPAGGEVPGLELRFMGYRRGVQIYAGPSLEAIAPVVARSEATSGAITRAGCDGEGVQRRCYALRLDPGAAITNADVASARVGYSSYDGAPEVQLNFTTAGAARFEALTTACVNRVMAIVVNGRIHSAPVVRSTITGGNAVISLGDAGGARSKLEAARSLAATLATDALAADWTFDR